MVLPSFGPLIPRVHFSERPGNTAWTLSILFKTKMRKINLSFQAFNTKTKSRVQAQNMNANTSTLGQHINIPYLNRQRPLLPTNSGYDVQSNLPAPPDYPGTASLSLMGESVSEKMLDLCILPDGREPPPPYAPYPALGGGYCSGDIYI
ncbi:hypothetical protein FOXG_20933 [Fusarium oxysporum f. sp. lycopersici 4287]|uniref:Uncharacterized protein n=1 Tax=Fusarium oxysporum f. sp. lycopersici (strain 4287 / CBS 123668 / FGSC 9935 / NRRL 34936) TaxID=426428 RepID=A0A0J9VT33_FUSO4|nr:hypothetical protein FOXG_20933 [Fusarium oxysporum f. sp. lycopersici 4287]EWZ79195.1 hypothetical protein FOWG_16642 [Fusarium oxysporum f. sp. lycopersici MN25]KNB13810.1 hypothetical protein FOXG_20933 [Fusarium oxysporum f. sp. lycopersici 4287]